MSNEPTTAQPGGGHTADAPDNPRDTPAGGGQNAGFNQESFNTGFAKGAAERDKAVNELKAAQEELAKLREQTTAAQAAQAELETARAKLATFESERAAELARAIEALPEADRQLINTIKTTDTALALKTAQRLASKPTPQSSTHEAVPQVNVSLAAEYRAASEQRDMVKLAALHKEHGIDKITKALDATP